MAQANDARPLQERRRRVRNRALVIDGDVLSRIETRLLLEMRGYQVDEVDDGMEAVGLLDLEAPPFDLVVLDYEMPALGGLETLYALRALQPGLKALLCVSSRMGVRMLALPERVDVLVKPFSAQDLARGLDRVYGIPAHTLEPEKVAGSRRTRVRRVASPPFLPR